MNKPAQVPEDVQGVLEIRDPAVDAEAIMNEIRARIRQRRAQAEAQGLDYDAFVEGLYAAKTAARFDRELYYDVRRLRLSYNKIAVGLSLTTNRLPVIGPLVQRVRAALHHLVLYYVNMMAGQQMAFNECVVRALSRLVKNLEDEPAPSDIKTLREQVNELQMRVQQLEEDLANK